MERRYFGPTRREVAVIGQGTWYEENEDPASAIAALRLGLDLGMKHIDTAEMYGSGAAERLVGQAIAGRRDEATSTCLIWKKSGTSPGKVISSAIRSSITCKNVPLNTLSFRGVRNIK
jgi:aryl-alcohol dehydrogenase-like predicted oxidoreductase